MAIRVAIGQFHELRPEHLRFAAEAIEKMPTQFSHKAMLGLEGRDGQIQNYQAKIRAVARACVPVLGLHVMPNSVSTTDRGGQT